MSNFQIKINNSIKHLFASESNNYIFIYTPPKVGSTTLVSSLRISLGKSFNIIHIHDEIMLSVLTGIDGIKVNDIIHYLAEIGKNVYVMDVYRTPIERKMSEFFEKISPYHFNNSEENINQYSIKRVVDRFNKIFPHIENNDHYFDKYNIGQPVSFDFVNKYSIQKENGIHYVKIRLCDSQQWASILSTIFQSDIVLITDYQTSTKKIGELYNKFKNEYRLPSNFLKDIQNCKYLNFYYNDQERNNYLDTWKVKLCEPVYPYTRNEFVFYMQICLENQYINDVQIEHYIDNGCFCKYCSLKRRDIYFKAKQGETHFDKIIHSEVIQQVMESKQKIVQKIINYNKKNITSKQIFQKKNQKFNKNQFFIQLK
jgi:hypothetical protein